MRIIVKKFYMKIYVFAYGSLLNPKSLQKTLSGNRTTKPMMLLGFQRKINALVNGYLYLNIVPRSGKWVPGMLIAVTKEELEVLKLREAGYDCVDVTDRIEIPVKGIVYAFIAPDTASPDLKIPRSYLLTCLSGKSEVEKKLWLEETLIENEIEEDLDHPVYIHAVTE